MHPSWW